MPVWLRRLEHKAEIIDSQMSAYRARLLTKLRITNDELRMKTYTVEGELPVRLRRLEHKAEIIDSQMSAYRARLLTKLRITNDE